MRLFTGWVMSAGLVLSAVAANAQGVAPAEAGRSLYTDVSDFGGPYAAMPPEVAVPGSGPSLLPPREVYTVLRESGFSPLGIPRQRGPLYVIAVIDRHGDNGRLVIDARDGQIVRFVPAYRLGLNFREDMPASYGPAGPPAVGNLSGVPRPPASVPKVASRMPATVPMPKASPQHRDEVKPLAQQPAPEPAQQSAAVQAKPAAPPAAPQAAPAVIEAKPAAPPVPPKQQSAAVQTKPADAPATPQTAPPAVEAKPAAPIQPTQPMPQVQGLE